MNVYLITRQNNDGSYDECGMKNRTVVSGYKTFNNACRYAIRPFSQGRACRVEIFAGSVLGNPIKTVFLEESAGERRETA